MKRVFLVAVLAIAVAGIASADFGTISITNDTAVAEGSWTIDVTMTMDTVGAASPLGSDWVGMGAQIYYPYTWNTAHPSFTTVWEFRQSGRTTNGGTPYHRAELFSHTAPVQIAGDWGVWTTVNTFSGAYGGTTWSHTYPYYVVNGPHELPGPAAQPTPTDNPNAGGAPIPTMNAYGIFAMVALLLSVAVLVIIRRR